MAAVAYGALLEAVRGVRWPARRAAPAGATGVHLSRARSAAPELAEYRAYRQGDEPRRIDWRLLARSDRVYIRLAPDRAVHPLQLVVDASASMAFGDKWGQACRMAVALAAVAHAQGDPVGVTVVGGRGAVRLPRRTRRGVVGDVARALDGAVPGGAAPLTGALQPPAARTVIVSDALGDEAALRAGAGALAASGREVWLVHLVARAELSVPPGTHTAEDPEDPSVRRPAHAGVAAGYEAAFAAWRREVADGWRARGCGYAMVVDDEPTERAVRRLVAARA